MFYLLFSSVILPDACLLNRFNSHTPTILFIQRCTQDSNLQAFYSQRFSRPLPHHPDMQHFIFQRCGEDSNLHAYLIQHKSLAGIAVITISVPHHILFIMTYSHYSLFIKTATHLLQGLRHTISMMPRWTRTTIFC